MSGERRAIRQAIATAFELDFKCNDPRLEKASDLVLDVFNRTRPLPGAWGIIAGGLPGQDETTEKIRDISERLERGLGFNNIGSHPNFNRVAKHVIEAEERGQTLETWIAWAHRDEKSTAYCFTYARNPDLIWQDWPQAFKGGIRLEIGL